MEVTLSTMLSRPSSPKSWCSSCRDLAPGQGNTHNLSGFFQKASFNNKKAEAIATVGAMANEPGTAEARS